jgi:hypothetical protein
MSRNGMRTVITEDANVWLIQQHNIKAIITSLPDMEEVGLDLEHWQKWVKTTCWNIMNSLSDDGIVIFYQTDRKYKGQIIDKKSLISNVFLDNGYMNIMSKIVLKLPPYSTSIYRPSYTNMFGFSKKQTVGKATPDVFYAGEMMYKNAMGSEACLEAIEFVVNRTKTDCIVDPFCGMGSVLKIANNIGLNSIGVDIDPEQTKIAEKE